MKPANSITSRAIYDKENDQHTTVYSKRGIELSLEQLSAMPMYQLFKKVWAQDDFGLVTVYTEQAGFSVRFVIEHSNIGYSCRVWVDNRPYHGLDGTLNGSQFLNELFK